MSVLCHFRANVVLKSYNIMKYAHSTAVPRSYHESVKKFITSRQHVCLSKTSSNQQLFLTPLNTLCLSKHYCDISPPQSNSGNEEVVYIGMKGLPYEANTEDIINFFNPLDVIPSDVSIIYRGGRSSGQAIVKFKCCEEALQAMKNNRKYMGRRYILLDYGVRSSNAFQPSYSSKRLNQNESHTAEGTFSGKNVRENYKVLLRGLPYAATSQDILEFFAPLNITPIDVQIKYSEDHRATGWCDVFFATYEDARTALKNDRAYIGKRYIDVLMPTTSRNLNIQKKEEFN